MTPTGGGERGGGIPLALHLWPERPWGVDLAMCGRFTLYTDLRTLQARFGLDVVEAEVGRGACSGHP